MSGLSEAFTENDNAIAHLLRQVVYLFYPHQCIVIMEALLFHHVLFEDDITKLCCMHRKVFRSFCNILVEDKLVSAFVQKEDAQQYKLYSRTYYYIHNIEAIDAIKWKVHTIVKKVKQEIGNFSEPQGYICPTCHHKYSLLDAASLLTDDKLNFECSICNDYLIDDDISQEQKKGQEKLEKIMSLVEPIIQYLKIVDDLNIDDNNFESTLMKYVPAFSDSLALYSIANKTTTRRKNNNNKNDDDNNNNNDPTKKAQATINVSITADDEDLKRERQKREDRNRKLRQNALPSWHQESTVGKAALGRLDFENETQLNGSETQFSNSEHNITEMSDMNDLVKTDQDASTLINGDDNPVSVKSENSDNYNTQPMANVNIPPSLPSLVSDTLSSTSNSSAITNSVPASFKQSASFIAANENTTSEEFDALSAYYSQLRQRQAVEQEEEEEEDEIEQEDLDYDENLDDFNEDTNNNVNVIQNIEAVPVTKNESHKNEDIKEEINEDDFDLDMFESDGE